MFTSVSMMEIMFADIVDILRDRQVQARATVVRLAITFICNAKYEKEVQFKRFSQIC